MKASAVLTDVKVDLEQWIMTSTEQEPLWLLLLPRAPSPISLANLRSAYGQIVTESLQKASRITKSTSVTQILDISVAYPGLVDDNPGSSKYKDLQNCVCQLYTLLCIICTEQSIEVDNGNDVDTRVVLLDVDTGDTNAKVADRSRSFSDPFSASTPNVQLLASCPRSWKQLSVIESEEGEALLDAFLRSRNLPGQKASQALTIDKVQPGTTIENVNQGSKQQTGGCRTSSSRHYSVAVGGTFDHLHAGHKLLLTMTALILDPGIPTESGRKRVLTVGITGDELLNKKQYVEELQDWDQRQENVREFLSDILMLDSPSRMLLSTKRTTDPKSGARAVRYEFKSDLVINCVEIFDPFGPTVTNEKISALVVSAETRSGGKAVNDRRSEKGWAALEVFEVDVLNAGDDDDSGGHKTTDPGFQNKISSTAIRQKIHLRHGDGTAIK